MYWPQTLWPMPLLHYAKVDTPIRAVMLSRLGPNVWHQDLTQAMATLEELEETAKLVQLTRRLICQRIYRMHRLKNCVRILVRLGKLALRSNRT